MGTRLGNQDGQPGTRSRSCLLSSCWQDGGVGSEVPPRATVFNAVYATAVPETRVLKRLGSDCAYTGISSAPGEGDCAEPAAAGV